MTNAQNLEETEMVDYLHNKLISIVDNVVGAFDITRDELLEEINKKSLIYHDNPPKTIIDRLRGVFPVGKRDSNIENQ